MKKLVPYSTAILALVLFLFWFAWPKVWFLFAFLSLILLLTSLFFLVRKFSWEFFGFFSGLFFLVLGSWLFLFFLESKAIKYVLIILASLFIFLILRAIYFFLYDSSRYIPYSLENIFAYSNLLSLFFIYVSSFSYWTLVILQLRYLIGLIFITTFILVWQTFWLNKISRPSSFSLFRVSILFALFMLELYWSLHFWPTSFFVNGLLMTVIFYFFSNILLHHWRATLQKKVLLRYLVISALVIISTLTTAEWL